MNETLRNVVVGAIIGLVIGLILGAIIGAIGLPVIGKLGVVYGAVIGSLGGVAGGVLGATREFAWQMKPIDRSIVGAVIGAFSWIMALTIIGKAIFGL